MEPNTMIAYDAVPRYSCSITQERLLTLELIQDWTGTDLAHFGSSRRVTLFLDPAGAQRTLRILVRNIATVAEQAASDPRRKRHVYAERRTYLGSGHCIAGAGRDGVSLMIHGSRKDGHIWIRHRDLTDALRALAEGSGLLSMQELLDRIAEGRNQARATNGAHRLDEIASRLEMLRAELPDGRAPRGARPGLVAQVAPLARTPDLRSHLRRSGREDLIAFVKRYAA